MSEQINRLRWKCRRGMRELDLLLKEFSETEMLDLSEEDNAIFNRVLDYDDQTLYDFIFKKISLGNIEHEIFVENKLKKFTKLENF
ncbi:MAG: succinate dehydrogenase assembly factor 2 [SAR86 cluster bacterium]|jgi:antitoxin CptB|uniref:FAD assembly factor SdhE n=1 Tax=SAR86 cluster bacterium TaxID=2030880 RepID=A0A937M2Z2_9GAMM|nr:succinate dehydrogenase assembly factor 2 [SAR86 cluster bacterium]MDG1202261.1 succinate dehydrogenase assembly factor 2 [SAR86 cluster bacterium]MDG1721735.1 succinate dehydrogenase assembly factor 2 [SAR86 cluster bacterium]